MTTHIARTTLQTLQVKTPVPMNDSGASTLRATTYGKALATTADMMVKHIGLRMIMLDRHDSLIGRMMEVPAAVVDMARVRYDPARHGEPSVAAFDAILEDLENEGRLGPSLDCFA